MRSARSPPGTLRRTPQSTVEGCATLPRSEIPPDTLAARNAPLRCPAITRARRRVPHARSSLSEDRSQDQQDTAARAWFTHIYWVCGFWGGVGQLRARRQVRSTHPNRLMALLHCVQTPIQPIHRLGRRASPPRADCQQRAARVAWPDTRRLARAHARAADACCAEGEWFVLGGVTVGDASMRPCANAGAHGRSVRRGRG